MSIKSTMSTLSLSHLLVYSISIKSAISTLCQSNLLFLLDVHQIYYLFLKIYKVYALSIKSTMSILGPSNLQVYRVCVC